MIDRAGSPIGSRAIVATAVHRGGDSGISVAPEATAWRPLRWLIIKCMLRCVNHMSDTTGDVEQVVRDLHAFSNGDASKRDALAASVDVYNPGLPEGEVHSRDDWLAYEREVKQGFPDFHLDAETLLVDGRIAMADVTITGTHTGEFKGLPPTDRAVEIHAMSKYVVEEGQVTEWHTFYDTGSLEAQLGMTFPEVIGQLPKLGWRKLSGGV